MTFKNNARLEIAIGIAVFASITIMGLETFSLPDDWIHALFLADVTLSVIFVIEYVLRIQTAENKRAYFTSFYGLIDLVALLPLLIHAATSLRVLRLLRVLRVLRLLKVTRYTNAIDRYKVALKSVVAEATLFGSAAAIFIISFAFLNYEVEHRSQPELYRNIFDSIWWAVISLTSVGYGDVYPVTAAGRMLTLAMVLMGMGIVAVPTALLASALSRAHNDGAADER